MLLTSILGGLAFSTLSISSAGFSSNDQYLNGDAWLLTVSADGNSQYAQGIISGQNIKDSTGRYAENDLTISTNVIEQSCDYELRQNYDPNIYKYDIQMLANGVASWSVNGYVDQCESKPDYYWALISDGGWFTYDVYCITKNKVGVPGVIKTPVTNFKAEIKMSADGDTETAILSSTASKSIRISNVGYAHWAGSLTSGESCPDLGSQGYNIIHDENGRWVLNKKIYYNNYNSYKINTYDTVEDDLVDKIQSKPALTKDDIENLKSTIYRLNNYASDAINEFGYTDFNINSNSLYSGQAHLELDKVIQFPVITMHVKASWLGIVVPVGDPEIVSVTSASFEEGKTGYITVKVRNDGNVASSFGLSADCQSPFKQIGTALTVSNLAPGSTSIRNIPISVSTNSEITKSCTVKVYDLNNPTMTDSKKVNVVATPIQVCSPGEERCDKETHIRCKYDDRHVILVQLFFDKLIILA